MKFLCWQLAWVTRSVAPMLARTIPLTVTEDGAPQRSPSATRTKWLPIACALLALGISACTTKPPAPPVQVVVPQLPQTLVPGDVLRLSFPGAVEMDQTQRIPTDGKLALPMIGEVRAAGRSLTSLQKELVGRYKPHLQNSAVVVSMQTAANAVYVTGAVNRPGKVGLERSMTLFEALMEAGGIARPFGDAKNVYLIRIEKGQHQTYRVDVSPALKGQPITAVYLKPYDVIYVSGSGSTAPPLSGSFGVQ
jgi:polysaccharide biosynthesis/export protein